MSPELRVLIDADDILQEVFLARLKIWVISRISLAEA